jgi:RNA polymerase primary sigma factor
MDLTDLGNDDPVKLYLREVETILPLTKDEETDLLQQWRSQDERADSVARRLIESKLSMVVSIAARFSSAGVQMLDLIQEGNKGLLLALRTLPQCSSDTFATHATACIEDAISKVIADSQAKSE